MTVVSYLELNPRLCVMASDGQMTWSNDAKCYLVPKINKINNNCLVGITGRDDTTNFVIDETRSLLSDNEKVNDLIDEVYKDQKDKYFQDWVVRRALRKGEKLTYGYKQLSRKKFEKDDVFCAYLLSVEYEKDKITTRYISNDVPSDGGLYFAIGCGEDPAIRSISQSLNKMLRDEFGKITLSEAVRIILTATLFSEGSGVGGEPQVYVLSPEGANKFNSEETMLLYRTLKFEDCDAISKDVVRNVFERIVDKKDDVVTVSSDVWKAIPETAKQDLLLKRFL